MIPPSPDAAALLELAEKYRALGALRTQRDGSDSRAARDTLRALADRHPGCLRELDTLGPAELERRATAAAAAAAGGEQEIWMSWIWAYHRLMRATLVTKRALGRGRPRPERLPGLAEEATRIAGVPLDTAFVLAVASPPQRRLGVVVLQMLGTMFAVPAAEIAARIFPARRPSPYQLTEEDPS